MTRMFRQAELLKSVSEWVRMGIGAISGHMSKSMIAKYAGQARQIMLAKAAIAKRGA